jgi:hypothetical protein
MENTMPTKPKGKKGKKPPAKFDRSVQVASGQKKAPPSKGDVEGHGYYPANYICWACHRINFVPGGVYAFYCWHCWRYNLAP